MSTFYNGPYHFVPDLGTLEGNIYRGDQCIIKCSPKEVTINTETLIKILNTAWTQGTLSKSLEIEQGE